MYAVPAGSTGTDGGPVFTSQSLRAIRPSDVSRTKTAIQRDVPARPRSRITPLQLPRVEPT